MNYLPVYKNPDKLHDCSFVCNFVFEFAFFRNSEYLNLQRVQGIRDEQGKGKWAYDCDEFKDGCQHTTWV